MVKAFPKARPAGQPVGGVPLTTVAVFGTVVVAVTVTHAALAGGRRRARRWRPRHWPSPRVEKSAAQSGHNTRRRPSGPVTRPRGASVRHPRAVQAAASVAILSNNELSACDMNRPRDTPPVVQERHRHIPGGDKIRRRTRRQRESRRPPRRRLAKRRRGWSWNSERGQGS
jgi:hypothetical protein